MTMIIYFTSLLTRISKYIALLLVPFVIRYYYKRYNSILANALVIRSKNFWTDNFGLIPPPIEEPTDTLSQFLIEVGTTPHQYPLGVSWSVFGTPLVIVNSLKGIKDVLIEGQARKKGGEGPKVQRGDMIRLIQNHVFGGKSINNVVGDEWQWRRHVLLPSFQPRQLVPNLLPYVVNRAQQLLYVFGMAAQSGEAIELDSLFQDLTMDVINFYLYGRHDLNYNIIGGRTNLKASQSWLPFGINKTQWAERVYGPSRALLKDFIRDSLLMSKENQNKAKERGEKAFESVAAAAMASGKYDENNEDLVNDFLSLTFAGYDTTAHTLSFCFSKLARSPQIQEELFQQVRAVLGPPPVDPHTITPEKLAMIPMITAVYRETLRKYPAVVIIPAHVNKDTVVDGRVVPTNAEIWCNIRGLQMNPDIFPNPEIFDPSRWIRPSEAEGPLSEFDSLTVDTTEDSSRVTPQQQYNFPDLSFTLGPHACLGKNLVILELRTTIACVVNEFTCRLKEGTKIDTKIVLTTKPRYGVWTHFEKRP
ncbi:cytochrome P450 [Spinellus fusiger]|nr:cytochrome P450 [Spinellus fusiger]